MLVANSSTLCRHDNLQALFCSQSDTLSVRQPAGSLWLFANNPTPCRRDTLQVLFDSLQTIRHPVGTTPCRLSFQTILQAVNYGTDLSPTCQCYAIATITVWRLKGCRVKILKGGRSCEKDTPRPVGSFERLHMCVI